MGTLIFALAGVMTFNLITETAVFIWEFRIVTQILAGAMISSRVGRRELREMKTILLPSLFLLIGMLVYNVLLGGAILMTTTLDAATALFAVSPGGATDMALISAELDANAAYVAILQLIRLILIFIVIPPTFKFIVKRMGLRKEKRAATAVSEEATPAEGHAERDSATADAGTKEIENRAGRRKVLRLGGLILFAAIGGLTFSFLGVVGGGIVGAMLSGIVFTAIFGSVSYPKELRTVLQILGGTFIGASITRETVATLYELIIPVAFVLAGIVIMIFGFGWLMHKAMRLDLLTCFLASAPGGIMEMAILSEEFGADTPKVSIMHTIRLITVIATFPTMLMLIHRALP